MSGNPQAYLTPADFSADLVALMPPGAAWRGPDLALVLAGCGDVFGDLHALAAQLTEVEMRPETTDLLLPDWEYDYGLPDCCSALADSTVQRVAALLAKIQTIGGQSAAYFIAVAAAMGYPITITKFDVARCNIARCGDRMNSEPWRFVWQVNCAANTITYALCNVAHCGDRLNTVSQAADLICRLNKLQPAPGNLVFSFS